MRVIAGEFRSRLLQAPRGVATRPTSDRLRQALFNVLEMGRLGPVVQGSRFVDLYAGSGAVGIEAMSRGAQFVWFAEDARAAVAAIRANLAALKVSGGYAVEDRGSARLLRELAARRQGVDLVFLDPPYEMAEAYEDTLQTLAAWNEAATPEGFVRSMGRQGVQTSAAILSAGALVVAEHARKRPLAAGYPALQRVRVLEQGDAALSFYQVMQRGV
ncbi:MAG: 16S rRNA (guanine(966)-N(2))-methyltransferase RsmD [Acidobacteriaceae bacterium]